MARRSRGDGAITQRHDKTCPPLVDGERAEHRCKGRWMAQLDLGRVGGKRQRKTIYGDTRKEVALKMTGMQQDLLLGRLVTGSTTVEEWLAYWLKHVAAKKLRDTSVEAYRQKIDTYIVPLIGGWRLDVLQPEHVLAMYDRLSEPCDDPDGRDRCTHDPSHGLSMTTVRMVHSILARSLKVAVRMHKAPYNVCDMIDAPTADDAGRTPLTITEARRVLSTTDDARWWCALYLGLRQGEALGLRWSCIDLEDGTIYIGPGGMLHWRQGDTPTFGDPKSAMSMRYIPVPPATLARLKIAWAAHVNAGGDPDGLVWHDGQGGPRNPRADREAWAKLLKRAGVSHVALHAARGTTLSLLDAAGVSPRVQTEIAGHSSVNLTQNVYVRGDAELRKQAMAALEQYVVGVD